MDGPASAACTLAIAGLPIMVTAPAEVCALLQRRYASFIMEEPGSRKPRVPGNIREPFPIHVQIEPAVDHPVTYGIAPVFRPQIPNTQYQFPNPQSPIPNFLLHAHGYTGELSPTGGALQLATGHPGLTLQGIDYFLRAAVTLLAFQSGGLLLHAAGLVRTGSAYLFIGPSGAGKTTVTRLSNAFDESIIPLSDDLVVVLPGPGALRASATPFWNPGSSPSPAPPAAPASFIVKQVLRLVQDTQVRVESLSQAQAAAELLACVPLLPLSPEAVPALFARCLAFTQVVPVARLHFRKEPSFWDMID